MEEINVRRNARERKIWKTRDERYIRELEKLYDLIDNIQNEKLKNRIKYQVAKFDNTLTQIVEEKYKI